jgi:hypothetical protein
LRKTAVKRKHALKCIVSHTVHDTRNWISEVFHRVQCVFKTDVHEQIVAFCGGEMKVRTCQVAWYKA